MSPLPFSTSSSISTLVNISKQVHHANRGADKKLAGSSSYVHKLQNLSNTLANNNVSLTIPIMKIN